MQPSNQKLAETQGKAEAAAELAREALSTVTRTTEKIEAMYSAAESLEAYVELFKKKTVEVKHVAQEDYYNSAVPASGTTLWLARKAWDTFLHQPLKLVLLEIALITYFFGKDFVNLIKYFFGSNDRKGVEVISPGGSVSTEETNEDEEEPINTATTPAPASEVITKEEPTCIADVLSNSTLADSMVTSYPDVDTP